MKKLLLFIAFLTLMLSCGKKENYFCYQCNQAQTRSTNLTDTSTNFTSQWIIKDSVVARVCDVESIPDTTLQKISVKQKFIKSTGWNLYQVEVFDSVANKKVKVSKYYFKNAYAWSEIDRWNKYEE